MLQHRLTHHRGRRSWSHDRLIYPLKCFFGMEDYVALDRNPGLEYNTLPLRLIPGDLLSACPHRQFHTLPGILDSGAALSNTYTNAWVLSREAGFVPFSSGSQCTQQKLNHRKLTNKMNDKYCPRFLSCLRKKGMSLCFHFEFNSSLNKECLIYY